MKESHLKSKLHEIIFEAETPSGRFFDIVLLWAIVISVLVVSLESVTTIKLEYGRWLRGIEWFLTILFTIEFLLRIYSVHRPLKYIFSFYGIVDLLAILPTYLSLYFTGAQSLIVIRTIRVLRVFRILKLARYIGEAKQLAIAIKASQHKITVFLISVVTLVIFRLKLLLVSSLPHSS